jgi:hypothetical protein
VAKRDTEFAAAVSRNQAEDSRTIISAQLPRTIKRSISSISMSALVDYKQDGEEAKKIAAVIPYYPFHGKIVLDGADECSYSVPLLCSALRYNQFRHFTAFHVALLHPTVLHCLLLRFTHCAALRCIALHSTALRCIALHCAALRCIALQCTAALHCCIAWRCAELRCAALRCASLRFAPLHYTAFYCIQCAAFYCASLRFIALHSTALHCTELPITLHCAPLHHAALYSTALL